MSRGKVAVVGAGIIGLACANYLRWDGWEVTVFDPEDPGTGASFGNAGCLNVSSVTPMSMPGVMSQVPRWLLDGQGPLAIRLAYLPALMPWLVRFVRAGRMDKVREQAKALKALLGPLHDSYAPLIKEAGADHLVQRAGHLIVYRSRAAFEKDRGGWQIRKDNGISFDLLDADEVRQLEPALARDLACGVLIAENGHCRNPHAMATLFAEAHVRDEGRIVRAKVADIEIGEAGVTHVLTEDGGRHETDRVVLAAGAWSRDLASKLGDKVPLETERGYHAMLSDPPVSLRLPVMSGEDKFIATPMENGLRLAGRVEFAGLHAEPDWTKARRLLELGRRLVPDLPETPDEDSLSLWMGRRPSMPDSLPVIGPSSATKGAFYAFGHGHVGLASAASTGRLVAELVGGKPPFIDPAPYRATRF